jgi:tRNA nucleotidyltransferase (CCA-adding enzyme)
MLTVDAMASILRREERGDRSEKEKLKLLFAVLCHDLGKPLTTTVEFEDGKILEWQTSSQRSALSAQRFKRVRAIGHEKAGLEPTRSLMYRLSHEHGFIESILPLVEHHLKPSQFYAQGAKSGAIKRLATKVNITELVMVAKADFLGRTTSEACLGEYPAGEWLLTEAKKLQVSTQPEKPLVQGRDLIAMGLTPSPQFKVLLEAAYQAQLEGKIRDREEAIDYLQRLRNGDL